MAATAGTMRQTITAQGTVTAAKTSDLSFTAAGTVTAVNVVAGQQVWPVTSSPCSTRPSCSRR